MNKPYTRKDLEQLILEVMGIKSITPMIVKQINKFHLSYDMSYKDMARCIVWYTEVAGKQLTPMYGLGILPNIKEQADKYFKQLELDRQKQEAEAHKIVEYQGNNIIFNIKSLTSHKRKPKQLDMNDINIEGDDQDD